MAQEEESAAVTALHPAAGQAPPPDPQCRDTQPVCLRLAVRYAPDMVLLEEATEHSDAGLGRGAVKINTDLDCLVYG